MDLKGSSFFVLLLTCYFANCCFNKNEFIKIEGLPAEETQLAYNCIEKLKADNPVLFIIVDELSNSGHKLTIQFSDQVKIGGFSPKNDSAFTIHFSSLDEMYNENTMLEEFFHAYQAKYYGYEKMLPNEKGIIKGAANIEYEAKLMKAIAAFYNDRAFFETPSQKGLLEFVFNLVDEAGKLKSFNLTTTQHMQYIKLVSHFQQHWQERNRNENVKSVYDHPVDSLLGPNACLYLFSKLK